MALESSYKSLFDCIIGSNAKGCEPRAFVDYRTTQARDSVGLHGSYENAVNAVIRHVEEIRECAAQPLLRELNIFAGNDNYATVNAKVLVNQLNFIEKMESAKKAQQGMKL